MLAVGKKLGLRLFGFDLLVCSRTNKMYIVDVNYFPSYSGVEGFNKMLSLFIRKVALSV